MRRIIIAISILLIAPFVLELDSQIQISSSGGVIANNCGAGQYASGIASTGTLTCSAPSGGAPTDATYITQTTNGSLSAEQALSELSSGIMRVATTTGVVTSLTDSSGIAANVSDETGSGALMFGTSPTFTTSLTAATGAAIRTNTTASNTLLFQAYNVNAASYTTVATLQAAADFPRFDISGATSLVVDDSDTMLTGVLVNLGSSTGHMNLTGSVVGVDLNLQTDNNFSLTGYQVFLENTSSAIGNIGTLTGLDVFTNSNNTNQTSGTMKGIDLQVQSDAAGPITTMIGAEVKISYWAQSGTLANAYGVWISLDDEDAGTIGNWYGVRTEFFSNVGTITTTYGLYVGDITSGTQTNQAWGLYVSDNGTRSLIENELNIGLTGVRITEDADGALTFLGLSAGADEDLTMNLDDVSNEVTWTSSTGLVSWNLSGIDLYARHILGNGATPSVANVGVNSCGTTAATIAGTDTAGKVTVGATSGTECRITFAIAFTNAPSCTVSNETTANLTRTQSTTTTADLEGTFVGGDVLAYICLGR